MEIAERRLREVDNYEESENGKQNRH